jgi:tRNA (adenine37-N6)-methyltransferase
LPLQNVNYTPIGIIYTPFKNLQDMPIQPGGAQNIRGKLVTGARIHRRSCRFNRLLAYLFAVSFSQSYRPPDDCGPIFRFKTHGVFATRAPKRPNPIGLSVVKLIAIEDNILILENIDILDKTPVLGHKTICSSF